MCVSKSVSEYCHDLFQSNFTHLTLNEAYRLLQCVTVPKMLNDTDTDTFFRYQIFSIPIPVLFPVPNFSDTGSETFFRYQIFPIPVPRLFSGTNFFRYRFRYHQKNEKFPVPGIPGTGTSHSGANDGDADQGDAKQGHAEQKKMLSKTENSSFKKVFTT